MNWLNVLKNGILIVIAILLYFRNRDYAPYLPHNVRIFFYIMIPLFLLEHLFCLATDLVSPVLAFIELYVVAKYADRYFIKYLLLSIVILTLISCMPMIALFIRYGYYARGEILFDKSMLTFFYGATYVILLLALKYSSSRYKWMILSILTLTILVNVFIMQSKTSIFVFLVTSAILSFRSLKKLPYIIRSYWWLIFGFIGVIAVLPINYEIPDGIKQAANKLTGRQIYELRSDMRTDTYDIRNDILARTMQIVDENPIMGAGFGNQGTALQAAGIPASQGESQIMDILLDGGLTYLIAFAFLTLPLLYFPGKRILNGTEDYSDDFVFYQTLGFLILCIGNEMLSSLGWFYLGSIVFIYNTRQEIRIIG